MIEVRHPRSWAPERRWVASVLLEEWLGLDVCFRSEDRRDTRIGRAGDGRGVAIADGLFAAPEGSSLRDVWSPRTPLAVWRVEDPTLAERLTSGSLPLVGVAAQAPPVTVADEQVCIGFDLLGAVFAQLTRLEETNDGARDRHGRFPLEASLAWRAGVHERPLADEYGQVLAWALWTAGVLPALPSSREGYRVLLTHDIDRPVAALEGGAAALLRRTGADVVRRRDVPLAWSRLRSWRGARHGDPCGDPSYSFDFLMDVAEAAGRRAVFTLLARASDEPGTVPPSGLDARYHLSDPFVDRLLRRILERGHAIGLHGSYHSYASPAQLSLEAARVRAAVERAGGEEPDGLAARQHYLRWEPATWRHLAAAGVAVDTTVGYAEAPGFRCGTCRPFPVFDLEARRPLPLVEHPLVVMDVTLDPVALQRGELDPIAARLEPVVDACRRVGGELVVLWHNDHVGGARREALYREVVGLMTAGGGG